MPDIPFYIPVTFILTTALTLLFFYLACRSVKALLIILGWVVLQGVVSCTGFYTVTDTLPPRFALVILPPLLAVLVMFVSNRGRSFIDGLDNRWLTWLHVVRVPVELVLFWLFVQNLVPQLMTFEGRNFDIISGLTAPLVVYFGYMRHKLPKAVMLGWNFICLGLLLNIVIHAVLSAPAPFQQLAFDQPNRALLYFPYTWLPGCIVPLVLFSHLVCIRGLLKKGV